MDEPLRCCLTIDPEVARRGPVQQAAVLKGKSWPVGSTLRIAFVGGSAFQKEQVRRIAAEWLEHANLRFEYTTPARADIRIAFLTGQGSWSAVGTDARLFAKNQPTMNFGWLDERTPWEEWRRVVLHEFGHALGLIHEHQSPNVTLDWNKDLVYRTFGGPPNYWTRSTIDQNIFARYTKSQAEATVFDPKSIMLYLFDGRFFKDGRPTNNNTALSDLDKQFIAKLYPRGISMNKVLNGASTTLPGVLSAAGALLIAVSRSMNGEPFDATTVGALAIAVGSLLLGYFARGQNPDA
jgi:serralysin